MLMRGPLDGLAPQDISRRLKSAQRRAGEPPEADFPYPADFISGTPRPAAVLIPLLRQEDAWHVLFTRRNDGLSEHSGQVAFPGGRADPDDTGPEMTALREAQEEIDLDPNQVNILGRLHDYITITNYRVTPVVGQIPWPFPFRLAAGEVSRVFTIPLTWLADPANHEVRQRILPAPYPPVSVIYFKPYDGEVLWGASAAFTKALLSILNEGE